MSRSLAALALALAAVAHAGQATRVLGQARAAQAEVELARALELARGALREGDATPEEVAATHRLIGELHAAMGARDEAVAAFARALELEPGLTLPPSASPKLNEPLRAARERAKGAPLSATVRSARIASGEVRTSVELAADPMHLVQRARLRFDPLARPLELLRGETFTAQWACDRRGCPHTVELLDADGNRLLTAEGTVTEPLAAAPPEAVVTPAPASGPRAPSRKLGPVLLAAAGLAAGLGGYFAYRFDADQRELAAVEGRRSDHLHAEALALDQARLRDRALLFTSLGLTAGLAAGAAFTW